MKIIKTKRNMPRGLKIFILAAFYLFLICFVSMGSSEDLAEGPEENILHKNTFFQRIGQEVEASGIGEINKENMYEGEADTEGAKTDSLVEVTEQEQEQETEIEQEINSEAENPEQKTVLEKAAAEKVTKALRDKDKAQSENVRAVGQEIKDDRPLNKYVLEVIETYPLGKGNYPYLLNNDYANYNGVTKTLTYQGKTLLKAHPSGNRASHCVGITFEVFFRAMQERNRQLGIPMDDFNGLNWDNLFDFAMNWYVASGSKQTNNIVLAVEKYGIGRGIHRLEEVQPGDFIDFNRENRTGHTVIFINWIKEVDGRVIGLRYWSSQGSTGGINYNEEYFNVFNKNGVKYGSVIKDEMYMVRILPVSQYK